MVDRRSDPGDGFPALSDGSINRITVKDSLIELTGKGYGGIVADGELHGDHSRNARLNQ